MKDPDEPLTEVETATVKLFLGNSDDWIWSPTSSVPIQILHPHSTKEKVHCRHSHKRALYNGTLYWLETCSKYTEYRGNRTPAIHVHQIFPTPSYGGQVVEQRNFSLWKNSESRDDKWYYQRQKHGWSLTYSAGFPCGLCWVTFGERVASHERPVNASLLWRITEDRVWHLQTDYREVFRHVFGDFVPAYYRDGWWTSPDAQACGHGDPDLLIERFHKVTGLSPNMVKRDIKSSLDEGFF